MRGIQIIAAGCLAGWIALGCATSPLGGNQFNYFEDTALTFEQAEWRKARISDVRYNLSLWMTLADEVYLGTNEISFELKDNGKSIPLDFHEGEVVSLKINDVLVPKEGFKRGKIFIELPAQHLKKGKNIVSVNFQQKFSRNGAGLHRFVDPEDQNVYIYTDFEPYDANRFIPCFDQPDLKARFQSRVNVPAIWQVISTTTPTVATADGGRKIWSFPESAPISTYIYSMHVGPYHMWTSKYKDIPLRLFARKSLAKYVKSEEWFKITRQGFEFFNKYFEFDYPFQKYDQLFVPEFNSGAMENVGAVTFTENYIKRGEYTRGDKLNMYSTLLHEMAHMWFGNLVTMKWWNDLWLNESFATYMAALAMAEATEFKEAWTDFHGDKEWAYYEDQLVTTHPIETEVENTNVAFANFDGITYGKGASVMKQAAYFLGAENFRKGVASYFKAHQYGNTELKDFIGALEKASSIRLDGWAASWLRTTGVDQLTTNFKCETDSSGRMSAHVRLNLSHPSGDVRQHSFLLAFMNFDGKKLNVTSEKHITMKEKEVVTLVPVQRCPDVVVANYKDHAYMKVALDTGSVEKLKTGLGGVDDPLLRLMIWANLWDMVRERQLGLKDYLDVALVQIPKENNFDIIKHIGATTVGRGFGEFNSLYYFWPRYTDAQKKSYADMVTALEKAIWFRVTTSAPGSDMQKTWFDTYVVAAQTSKSYEYIAGLLKGTEKIAGLSLDPDRRWNSILKLCKAGYPDALGLKNKEKASDKSDFANKASLTCEVNTPNIAIKKDFFKKILDEKSTYSFAETRKIMGGLFPAEQVELKKSFESDFYGYMKQLLKREDRFQENFSENLNPTYCDAEANSRLKKFVESSGDLPTTVLRPLRQAVQEDARCIEIRKRAALGSS